MYSEKVMDHFEHPRNVGEIENASGVGTVGNAKCGDIMRMYLDIDENGVIQDCKLRPLAAARQLPPAVWRPVSYTHLFLGRRGFGSEDILAVLRELQRDSGEF